MREVKKQVLYIFLYLLVITVSNSQNYKLQSMGDLFITVEDQDNKLNLYAFGGNPAGIAFEEIKNKVFVDLNFGNTSGDYRRIYEPGELELYELKFIRYQNLGKNGNFKGFAIYSVENRKNLYRSLLLNPYDGKAFYVTDTTNGNFKYTGPKIGFDYGLTLTKKMSAGVKLTYSLFDGLKDIYTRTRTVYRNIKGEFGIAFIISKKFNFGLTFEFSNAQEKLEAKSEDLYDAEVYLFRGDIYSIKRRSNVVNLKFKENTFSTGLQIVFAGNTPNAVALNFAYNHIGKFLLVPYGLLEEYEFGYANWEIFEVYIAGRFKMNKSLSLGFCSSAVFSDVWSKHSERNLLLWRQKIYNLRFGFGSKFVSSPENFLTGIEFIIEKSNADSMKYIDNRFAKISGYNFSFKFGFEYKILKSLIFRAGSIFRFYEKDIWTGINKVKYYKFTSGVEINSRFFVILNFAQYKSNFNPMGYYATSIRKTLKISLSIKLM